MLQREVLVARLLAVFQRDGEIDACIGPVGPAGDNVLEYGCGARVVEAAHQGDAAIVQCDLLCVRGMRFQAGLATGKENNDKKCGETTHSSMRSLELAIRAFSVSTLMSSEPAGARRCGRR